MERPNPEPAAASPVRNLDKDEERKGGEAQGKEAPDDIPGNGAGLAWNPSRFLCWKETWGFTSTETMKAY